MSPRIHAAQIANARKSHGPVTEAGRLHSSANSARHGLASRKLRIIPPEDREEFDQHCSQMLPALAPDGPIENHLADLIVFDEWRMIRIRGLENEIFAMGSMTAKDQLFAAGETWLAKSKELATLTLYEQRIGRVLARNKAEFEARQSARNSRVASVTADTESPSPEASGAQLAEPEICAVAVSAPIETGAPQTSAAEIAAQKTDVGIVHSSATTAPTSAPQPRTPAVAAAGFVHSSATSASNPDPQPPTPAVAAAGFVHSSAAASPNPDPQPRTPAVAAAGFVHSSAAASPNPDPQLAA